MSKHELYLDISDSQNSKIMRVYDTSHYCDDDALENYLIEVLPVNKSKWITFHIQRNFSLALNSSNLGYKKVSDIADLQDLPDGIYEIKQSYKPNIHTLQHYYHLRITEMKNKLRSEWDKLLEAGGYVGAKEKGWLRVEGKEYIVQDGDVVHFRFAN
mgnify:CR=1 FL=1